jgi:hypothetical protein
MHTIFSLEDLKGKDHLQDLRVVGNIKIDLQEKRMGRCGLYSSGSG